MKSIFKSNVNISASQGASADVLYPVIETEKLKANALQTHYINYRLIDLTKDLFTVYLTNTLLKKVD